MVECWNNGILGKNKSNFGTDQNPFFEYSNHDGFVKSPIQPIIVIPVLARRSASVRRRENGNPVNSNTSGLLLEFIPMQIGAGVTD